MTLNYQIFPQMWRRFWVWWDLRMFNPPKLQLECRIKRKTIPTDPTDPTDPSALGTKRSWRRKLSTEATFLWRTLISTCFRSELCSGSLRVCSGTLLTQRSFLRLWNINVLTAQTEEAAGKHFERSGWSLQNCKHIKLSSDQNISCSLLQL